MSAASSKTPTSSKTPVATFADLLAIPEDERFHEILDGELLRKEAAGIRHSVGQARLSGRLSSFDGKPNGPSRPGGWWILTEPTIYFSRHQIVQCDVAGWRRERLPELPSGE